jgi:hypothetical protein
MARRKRSAKKSRTPRARRNRLGRFTRLKANPVKRRKRRALKRNPSPAAIAMAAPRANPAKKRKSKKRRSAAQKAATKRGGSVKRKRKSKARRTKRTGHKRLRRNPGKKVARRSKAVTRSRKRRFTRRSKGLVLVKSLHRAAKKTKRRSLNRSVAMAQYHRASALRRLTKRSPGKAKNSALSAAMSIKTNPGLAGIMTAAKVLVPQAGAGAVSLVSCSMAGRFIAKKITHDDAGLPREMFAAGTMSKVAPYMPAIVTVLTTGVGYVVADKVAPKFKGAVAIGGILGAVIQAIAVAAAGKPDSFAGKAISAIGLGDYTLVGDYTTVGNRGYAESGIFRNINGVGDYTTIGQGADNGTEFAHDSLRGLDDNTEFADGEGGVLSGGMFRGPSSR